MNVISFNELIIPLQFIQFLIIGKTSKIYLLFFVFVTKVRIKIIFIPFNSLIIFLFF